MIQLPFFRRSPYVFTVLVSVLMVVACRQVVMPDTSEFEALPLHVPERPDNPQSAEKVALGKLLFYDPILSGEKDVSCASCHHPTHAYGDGLGLSLGVGAEGLGPQRRDRSNGRIARVRRNAPTLINVGWNGLTLGEYQDPALAPMFWDNRVLSLEAQALEPIRSHEEMRGDALSEAVVMDSIVARLRAISAYEVLFSEAFPGQGLITEVQLGQALAVYQRSLVAPNSRFDRYLRGETEILSTEELAGMDQFVLRGCATCHSGAMLSDFKLHRLGVADNALISASDRGNGNDQFRTPTLRNVTRTAPYMHNGTQTTLEEVMEFYNDQTSLHPHVSDGQLATEFRELQGMSNRRRDQIIAFLHTLEDEPNDTSVPTSVPSGLPVGGNL